MTDTRPELATPAPAAHRTTVIVTRPSAQAAPLSGALRAAGFATFEFPLLDIAPVADPQPVRDALARLGDYALAVFVSPNAIEHALVHFNGEWPAHVPIGVLGPGSVRALAQRGIAAPRVQVIAPRGAIAAAAEAASDDAREQAEASAQASAEVVVASDAPAAADADADADAANAGNTAVQAGASAALEAAAAARLAAERVALDRLPEALAPGPARAQPRGAAVRYDSEALLDALDQGLQLDSLVGKRVLLIKGDGGRELLAQTLQAMGVSVDAVSAYQRSAPHPEPGQWQGLSALLAAAGPVVWVVTSSEGIRHLDLLARKHLDTAQLAALRRCAVMAPHERIAEAARSLGFDTVTVSGAGDRNIVRALSSQAAQLNTKRMTDKHDTQTDSESAAGAYSATRTGASAGVAPKVAGTPYPDSGSRPVWERAAPTGMAQRVPLWIGLVVLLGALGAVGYGLNHRLQRNQQALTQRQDASDARIAATLAQTQQALAQAHDLSAQQTQFGNKLQDAQAAQQALQQQYQDFTRNRDDWTLAEIGQMLSTASEQLQLTGNVQLALFALQSADARLATATGAQMLTVRRAVQRDIEKLKAAPQVDVAGLAIKLDDAIAQVDTLPLLGEARNARKGATGAGAPAAGSAAAAPPVPAWRAWIAALGDDMTRSLKSLVQVRRIDNADAMLVAPEQGYYLRANLKLRLLSARLSLLARNPVTLKSDLGAASGAVTRYFDPSSKQVQTVQSLLQQVDQASTAVQLPDMNGSLTAVNQFKSRG